MSEQIPTVKSTTETATIKMDDTSSLTANDTVVLEKKCNRCDTKKVQEVPNEATKVVESESNLIDIKSNQNIVSNDDIKINENKNNEKSIIENNNDNKEMEQDQQKKTIEKQDFNDIPEVSSKYIDEPELSLVQIHERIIEKPISRSDSGEDPDYIDGYEHETIHHVTPLDDSESEEDDKLRPLIMDNHTIREFCALNAIKMREQQQQPQQQQQQQEEVKIPSLSSSIVKTPPMVIVNKQGSEPGTPTKTLIQSPMHSQIQTIMKHSDTKDSFSSIDSDVSLNYDRRGSNSSQQCNDYDNSDKHYSHYSHYSNSSSDDNAKDSGCDIKLINNNTVEVKEIDTLCPSEIPDDKLSEEIVEQVEYYFSNDNILKDAFLLKHVRRNKEGFVSLKLVSSFKRVRQFTKDWRVVGHAIRKKGRRIELNDVATKIRRIEPLPTFDETMPSRTIVACDIPVDKLTIERVSDIFSKCGEIALVRILRPGNTIPADVRQFINKYPETQQKECALVEFVESQSARFAQNMNVNFKIYEMVAPKKKTGKKSTAVTVTKLIEHYKYHDSNCERNRGGNSINNQNHSIMGSGGFVGNIMHQNDNDYNKFKLRRNNSADYYVRPEQQHICQPRKYSFNSNMNNNNINNNNNNSSSNMENNFSHFSPRRISNNSCQIMTSDNMMPRKYSSCSEGYSSCSDQLSRRTSSCSSEQSRRTSNCSEYCACSRRMSQCSDMYRRMSQCSEHNNIAINNMNNNNNNSNNNNNNTRKFSSGPINYDRSFSNQSNHDLGRRTSLDSSYDRKMSSGSMGSNNGQFENYRKYSNGFDPNRKLSNTDQYFNGRRISTDSGYDRKLSFGSDYSGSPRSRSNSFMMMCQHKNGENVVRTPIGPDGSKGFTSRTRKVGQIVVSPV